MFTRLRHSLALKLILASAIPSAAVLLVGLGALIAHASSVARTNPLLAFVTLQRGAILGTLLSLTFAGIAIALAARHFLIKPLEELKRVMARAELGEFLVRAKVEGEDEISALSRGFNTMLARITDMAATDLEARASLEQLEREVRMRAELKELNAQLEAHIGEMELLLEVSKAVSGTLDLAAQLTTLGRELCARLGIDEFSLMLVDDSTHELVIEAVAGAAPHTARGMRFHIGEGVTGAAAGTGRTVYVPDVEKDARYLHYKGHRHNVGSFLCVPLRSKGVVVGVMNLNRARTDAFSQQEIRLAEAIGQQAALAIANARLYQQTLELSFTDPLTGIANRRQLLLRLEQEYARAVRFGEPLSVLMADLDLFKAINDQYGHTVGDGVLRGVALTLRRNLRGVDVVARYGGEEFCIVLPRVGKVEAMAVAEKLRRAVGAATLPGPTPGAALGLTISLGVASLDKDATDAQALIEKADRALYEAKRLGRDRVAADPSQARATA